MTRKAGRVTIAFLLAVLASAVPASIVQTQINLAGLVALGAPVTPGIRALTTLQDIVFFGPVMAAIAAAAFLPAFLAARLVCRALPSAHLPIFAMAGAASLWVAFATMGVVTPMPTFVAAARTLDGALALSATGLLGGAVFASLGVRRSSNEAAGA